MWTRRVVGVIAVCAATACGSSEPEEPEAEEQETRSEEEAEPEEPEPEQGGEQEAEVEEESHPLEGSWVGPPNESGELPTMEIYPSGTVFVDSDGITCSGDTEDLGGGEYLVAISECIFPISARASLSDDGETLFLEGDEEWSRDDSVL